MIDILKLKEHLDYKEICKNIYEESFPAHERWDFDVMLKRENEKPFDVYAIVDDNKAVGIYVPWTFDDFMFIEFIAIDKNSRGKNYGSTFLKYVLENNNNKNIVIEVEPSEVSEYAKKRIEWYERFGFIMCNEKYYMPSLSALPKIEYVDMKIMTTKTISKNEFEKIKNILHKSVYELHINNT